MQESQNLLLGMSGFRPEPHVAQQSRRDKLRIQHIDPVPDLVQVRDVYDPALFSSSAHGHNLPLAGAETSMTNPSAPSGLTRAGDPRSAGLWRGQPSCDWIVASQALMTNPMVSPGVCHSKPGFSGYPDASDELSTQQNHEQQCGDLHFPSSQIFHQALQEVVTSVGDHGLELASIREPGQPCSWVDSGNELLLLPSYGDQPNTVWVSRQPPQWNGEGGLARGKVEEGFDNVGSEGGTQGLSLTLSSNLHVAQLEERFGFASSRANGAGQSCPYPTLSIGDRGCGGSLQGMVSSAAVHARRGAGPLGPFTGYATILKYSKFLKPAQHLLDEYCSAVKHCHVGERSCGVVSSDCGDVVAGEKESSARGGSSGMSSSSLHSSAEAGASGEASQIHRPEMQQKKAKLLYMLEEVCRRYKQYHQQMQMVVSAFESVAGLSSATPYASLALRSVSKHFRCLKNAISEQLQQISKVLGEEFMSSPSSCRGEIMMIPKLKHADQIPSKQKAGENSLSFMDQNQPVWRPQRGLPERAVSVLRTWLFDHFLHPYPTDTDKHMLATQTGLSRNQVSNWFINARVRLWKPMVEEIHMLETKGMNGMDLNTSNRNDAAKPPPIDDAGRPPSGQRLGAHQSNKPLDCSSMEPVFNDEGSQSMEGWHCEKRSRIEECGIPASMDGNLVSFGTFQGAMDIGGLGAVSLTLGLRHEGGQQQQQMRHFGGQMLHEFVD